ncbi:MAG TPA: hypothetical protein VJ736_08245 [Actinomycetota bacterium]|jgi:hypothetical protein|nr:hypothetical protein [Actinomycetota bacterium]
MVRFQRQPPGTALTRTSSALGMGCAVVAGVLIVDEQPVRAGVLSALSGGLLLLGGHRANHGLGGPVDRMLTELFDRAWDACLLAPIVWVTFGDRPEIALGALVALCASFLSSYVRARGAALGYSIEESHVTRGVRYGAVSAGLLFGWLPVMVWVAAGVSALAAIVRTGQVAREARA